jgi:hypothetical protein
MGREIRKVIPNWEHPRTKCEHSPWNGGCDDAKRNGGLCLEPLYDNDYDTAATAWIAGLMKWESGEDPDREKYGDGETRYYWEWNGSPPERRYYRPQWADEEATWFQGYETVSEGTPVTPPFATKAELVDYLVKHGDYWDQYRGDGGWSRRKAEQFVESEFAVSMVIVGSEIKMPRDGQF